MIKGENRVHKWKVVLVISLIINLFFGYFWVTNFGEINRLVKVTSLIKAKALVPASNDVMFEGALSGIVASLNDPYSNYLSPREYQDLMIQVQGSFGGLGILVGMREDQITVGAAPFKNTPAERAGLQAGDVILQINGESTEGMDLDGAIERMRGTPGSTVELLLKRENGETPIALSMQREIINIPSLRSEVLEENKQVGYIHLYSFSGNSPGELAQALTELRKQGIKGLVLDLRNNGGGDFSVALEIANHFVPKGPIVQVVGRDDSLDIYEALGTKLDIPFVVLINNYSASASEILAGAIKDTQSGALVGTQTYGKGLVQALFPLSGKAGVKLTTHKYLTPNGNDINQKGIAPDYLVELDPEGTQDQQLNKALEVLQQQM